MKRMMTVMKNMMILLCAIVALTTHAFADTPSLPPKSYVTWSPNKTYTAKVSLEKNNIAFYEGDHKKWDFPSYHRFLVLTDLDEYIVIPYWGVNLIETNYKKEQPMVSVIYKGKLKFEVHLDDIIFDFNRLQRTASHYHWGFFNGFIDERHFSMETVENNKIIVDVVDGSITVTPLAVDETKP